MKINTNEKIEYTYPIHLDEFVEKMRKLGHDDKIIEKYISIAEEFAPKMMNTVHLAPYLVPPIQGELESFP